jgi:hypothetical protein
VVLVLVVVVAVMMMRLRLRECGEARTSGAPRTPATGGSSRRAVEWRLVLVELVLAASPLRGRDEVTALVVMLMTMVVVSMVVVVVMMMRREEMLLSQRFIFGRRRRRGRQRRRVEAQTRPAPRCERRHGPPALAPPRRWTRACVARAAAAAGRRRRASAARVVRRERRRRDRAAGDVASARGEERDGGEGGRSTLLLERGALRCFLVLDVEPRQTVAERQRRALPLLRDAVNVLGYTRRGRRKRLCERVCAHRDDEHAASTAAARAALHR